MHCPSAVLETKESTSIEASASALKLVTLRYVGTAAKQICYRRKTLRFEFTRRFAPGEFHRLERHPDQHVTASGQRIVRQHERRRYAVRVVDRSWRDLLRTG